MTGTAYDLLLLALILAGAPAIFGIVAGWRAWHSDD